MNQARYIGFRLVQSVFLIWAVVTLLFFFFRLMPGSYADLMLAQGASPEVAEQFVERWGLNDPLYVQYGRYMENLLHLNMGSSLQFNRPVLDVVGIRIFNSFILIAPAITFAYILGSGIGVIFGSKRGSRLERWGILPLIFLGSFPAFFTAMVLIVIFAGWLDLFPTSGMLSAQAQRQFGNAVWWRQYVSIDFAMHYILPFTAVVLRYLFLPSLIMRTNVVEVIDQDFMNYHRLTGVSTMKRLRQLAKHASLPVITLYPVSLTRALGGLVLIETVFNWQGIGFTLVNAVLSRDFPIIQFVFLLIAVFIIFANLIVDIVYGYIDPRVRIGD